MEGKKGGLEVTGRRGRRRKRLLDDPQEGRRSWKSKEKALDDTAEKSLWKRLWTRRKTKK